MASQTRKLLDSVESSQEVSHEQQYDNDEILFYSDEDPDKEFYEKKKYILEKIETDLQLLVSGIQRKPPNHTKVSFNDIEKRLLKFRLKYNLGLYWWNDGYGSYHYLYSIKKFIDLGLEPFYFLKEAQDVLRRLTSNYPQTLDTLYQVTNIRLIQIMLIAEALEFNEVADLHLRPKFDVYKKAVIIKTKWDDRGITIKIKDNDIIWSVDEDYKTGLGGKKYNFHFTFHRPHSEDFGNPNDGTQVSSMSYSVNTPEERVHFMYGRINGNIVMTVQTPTNPDHKYRTDNNYRTNVDDFTFFISRQLNRLHTKSLTFLRDLGNPKVYDLNPYDKNYLAKLMARKRAENPSITDEPSYYDGAWKKYLKYKAKYLKLKAQLNNK